MQDGNDGDYRVAVHPVRAVKAKGGLKMKTAYLAIVCALAAAFASAGAQEPSIVYRGKLVGAVDGEEVDFGASTFGKRLRFALYDRAEGGETLWTSNMTASVSRDGTFAVELAGEELAAAVKTHPDGLWVGLRIGDAHQELFPRRAVLPVPLAGRAVCAERPASGAVIGRIETPEMKADSRFSAITLRTKELSAQTPTEPVTVDLIGVADGARTKILRGGGVTVYSESPLRELATVKAPRKNQVLAVADGDGVALLHSVSGGDMRVAGCCQFCRAGDRIICPTDTQDWIRVSFRDFAE